MCVCVNEIMSSSFLFSEQANKKGYWINELESLGISPKEIVENNYNNNDDVKSNSIEELANFVDNIKQTMYQEYKTVYSERLMQLEAEEHAVVVV
jgi:pheromone shutdown protein TraB